MNRKKKDAPEAEPVKTETAAQAEEELAEEAEAEQAEQAQEAEQAEEVNPLEEELAKQKESYLRLAAEYDNFRKRSVREKEALSADIRSDTISELLPVMDNLERALSADNASLEDFRKGVEMVLTQTTQIFGKLGVTAFCEAGDEFDPQIHHCIGMVADEQHEAGQVALVVARGYMLGDKVVRPAMVQVVE